MQPSKPTHDIRHTEPNPDKYRLIVENAPEILALIGDAGMIVYVSPYTEKVLGYRLEELEGRDIFEFVHPEDIARAAQEYSDTVQRAGEKIPSILRFRDSSGSWIPFEIVANNRLFDPNIHAVVFTARDLRFRKEVEAAIHRANEDTQTEAAQRVTELARINAELRIENQARRQAESQLQRTISLLNATLESTADGVLVISNDGKVSSCNKKFAEMWHLGSECLMGEDDKTLLAKVTDQIQDPDGFLARIQELLATPSAARFDIVQFKDGRIFERYSQPQRINDKIMGRVWSFRDVTRARTLEQELRQSQKMEALGRLAGGIAHDFNNLLMLITLSATKLLENPSPAEGRSLCKQILATARQAASVTKQLLAFSRKQPEVRVAADLNAIVASLEHMLRRLLSSQIGIKVSLASDAQPVYVDVSQVEMMIMNLALNAQDAMPQGGLLSISTKSGVTPNRKGEISGNGRKFSVLEVSDTGHGMTPEVQARIFEPFFTTKPAGRGTGLGLSTVLGIAERSAGYVDVQSQPDKGTTLRIYLPRVEAVPDVPAATSIVSAARGGSETLLLLEDETGIRSMTRAYLESLGYRMLEAADGLEAIRLSMEYNGPIDLVLADILMPGMRGDSAVRAIRSHRPRIKALFISGCVDQSLGEDQENILYKPFDFYELGRRVRSVLDADATRAARRAG
jgi:two-component system, cell cycle sensor histidine kinase and response regulator CckA